MQFVSCPFHRLQQRQKDESGFTLIELLVVILIIGILAAIAIPAFLNQKNKATDAAAKTQVRTAQTAAETYATDHNGEYKGMTAAELQAIEPTLNETTAAELTVVKPTGSSEYEVTSEVKQGAVHNTFTIKRLENGTIERTCKTGAKGACPANEKW